MFGLAKLLGVLGAMIVVPTVAYVLGETTADIGGGTPARPQPPAMMQNQQNPNPPQGSGGEFFQPGPGMMGGQGIIEEQGMMRGRGMMEGGGGGGRERGSPGMMQGGQGTGDNFGGMMQFQQGQNSDDFQQRMGQEQQRREQEQQQREQGMLKQIKRDAPRGAKQPLNALKSQIVRVERLKIAVPEEIKKFITDLEAALAALESAQTFEEAQDAIAPLEESQSQFQDYFRKLEEARRWPSMLSQAKRELKRLESTLASAMRQSKRKGAIDISEQINELSQAIVTLKATLESAQQKASSGDIEEAIESIREDFFGALEDLDDVRRTIDMLGNIGRTLKQIPLQLKQYAAELKRLKVKKVDTSEADALLVQMNVKLREVQTLAAAKPVDEESLINAIESGSELMVQFEEIRNQLLGRGSEFDELFEVKPQAIPKFDLGLPQNVDAETR